MPFTLDRYAAADSLAISTRTLDRYVKAGKLRSKKVGKKVFVHDGDLDILKNELGREVDDSARQEDVEFVAPKAEDGEIVFFDDAKKDTGFRRKPVLVDYQDLFEDAQKRIDEKDRVIRELSYRVGQAEAELKNSVSMIEFKKTSYLLEAAKTKGDEEKANAVKEVEAVTKRLESEKNITAILAFALAILLLGFLGMWFATI
ncbi:MAG: hypothetical protein WA194_07985 [Patescibacteria group bacterium]